MFDIFGEFDSAEAINAAAAGQKEQGDKEALITLAKENGIDEYSAEAYWSGAIPELTDAFGAAVGKLQVELEPLKKDKMPVRPIMEYLASQCMDERFARTIRRNRKSLKACIKEVEQKAKEECSRTKEQYIADMTIFEWAKEYYER